MCLRAYPDILMIDPGKLRPVLGQCLGDGLVRLVHHTAACYHDDIHAGQLRQMVAEAFPDDSFDPVSDHRLLCTLP